MKFMYAYTSNLLIEFIIKREYLTCAKMREITMLHLISIVIRRKRNDSTKRKKSLHEDIKKRKLG